MKLLKHAVVAAALFAGYPAMAANVTAGATSSVDATTTGSVGNYGSLISALQSKKALDLSTVTEGTMITVVKVSSLSGDPEGKAQALDNALTKNAPAVAALKASITANTGFAIRRSARMV